MLLLRSSLADEPDAASCCGRPELQGSGCWPATLQGRPHCNTRWLLQAGAQLKRIKQAKQKARPAGFLLTGRRRDRWAADATGPLHDYLVMISGPIISVGNQVEMIGT